eukprot:gene14640-41619_t
MAVDAAAAAAARAAEEFPHSVAKGLNALFDSVPRLLRGQGMKHVTSGHSLHTQEGDEFFSPGRKRAAKGLAVNLKAVAEPKESPSVTPTHSVKGKDEKKKEAEMSGSLCLGDL